MNSVVLSGRLVRDPKLEKSANGIPYTNFTIAVKRNYGDEVDFIDCSAFRGIAEIPVGNRFLEYVLFPDQNISLRIVDGRNKAFAMISVGHSIINRTSAVDVGSLVLKYGGGGHRQVGTCQVDYGEVDRIVGEMLQVINPG